jgi:hypothetical protein
MRKEGCLLALPALVLLVLPGCPEHQEQMGPAFPEEVQDLEKSLQPLQEKKVVAFEVEDVETGSEEVVRIEDEKIIRKLLEVAARPNRQVVQMAFCAAITFFFEDGSRAVGTFGHDADRKRFYVASWVLEDKELWEMLKEPLKLPDKRPVPEPPAGPPPKGKVRQR